VSYPASREAIKAVAARQIGKPDLFLIFIQVFAAVGLIAPITRGNASDTNLAMTHQWKTASVTGRQLAPLIVCRIFGKRFNGHIQDMLPEMDQVDLHPFSRPVAPEKA